MNASSDNGVNAGLGISYAVRTGESFTPDEVEALGAVLQVVDAAADATPQIMSESELVASGWPARIAPAAAAAVSLMEARGRFREDREEAEPSLPSQA